MDQNFQCKYCGVKFHRESTLSTHMCVKKRRYMDINSTGSRIGFRAFCRFFEMTTNSRKEKTHQNFIDSPYYTDFVKFGNYLALLRPIYIDKYIEFVIFNGIKLKDWTNEEIYKIFIADVIKKEPAISAVERGIEEIMSWCDKNSTSFSKFFDTISANEAAYLIGKGYISPWILYLSKSGDHLLSSFNEDHAKMIGDIIDPGFWMKKFKKHDEDVAEVSQIMEDLQL